MFAQLLFLLYKDKSNFVYVLVHRNILMYNNTCIPFIYVDMHLKTILAVCLVFIFYEVRTTSTAYEKDTCIK